MKIIPHGDLCLSGTDELPTVSFSTKGYLKIEGRIALNDICEFAQPLLRWVRSYTGKSVIVDIKTEYLSEGGLGCISSFMTTLEDNPYIKNILLNWYYDEQDDEYFEKGISLESGLKRTMVNHIGYAGSC